MTPDDIEKRFVGATSQLARMVPGDVQNLARQAVEQVRTIDDAFAEEKARAILSICTSALGHLLTNRAEALVCEISPAVSDVVALAEGVSWAAMNTGRLSSSSVAPRLLAKAHKFQDADLVRTVAAFAGASQEVRSAAMATFEYWPLADAISALDIEETSLLEAVASRPALFINNFGEPLLQHLDTIDPEQSYCHLIFGLALQDILTRNGQVLSSSMAAATLLQGSIDPNHYQERTTPHIVISKLLALKENDRPRYMAAIRTAFSEGNAFTMFATATSADNAERCAILMSASLDDHTDLGIPATDAAMLYLKHLSSILSIKRLRTFPEKYPHTIALIEKAVRMDPARMLKSKGVSLALIGVAIGFDVLSDLAGATRSKPTIKRVFDLTIGD